MTFDAKLFIHWDDAAWPGGVGDGGVLEPQELALLDYQPAAKKTQSLIQIKSWHSLNLMLELKRFEFVLEILFYFYFFLFL
jgi:hypothetical protein